MYGGEPNESDRNFYVVRVKYINLNSVEFMTFTKLGMSTGQRQTHVVYKVGTRANCNLMPLNMFKTLFLKSTFEELHTTKIMPWY